LDDAASAIERDGHRCVRRKRQLRRLAEGLLDRYRYPLAVRELTVAARDERQRP
jgi:hypothetical protein